MALLILLFEVIKININTIYIKQGQSTKSTKTIMWLKNIKLFIKHVKENQNSPENIESNTYKRHVYEIYNLTTNTKIKKMQKIVNNLKSKDINGIVLSKQMHLNNNFINIINSNNINIFDGKWLIQYIVTDIIKFLEKKGKIKTDAEVAILSNDLTEEVKGNIKELIKKFKKIRIITNHSEKFKKIEETLYEEEGVPIIIVNNKKKALTKSDLIINFDFVEESINQYNINENAVILNLDGKIKINKKRFSGTIITDYEVEKKEDVSEEEKLLLEEFYCKELYEEKIYKSSIERIKLEEASYSKFEIIRKIIDEEKILIKQLYGINGIIQ